jgi:tol-pal system protein YbgF
MSRPFGPALVAGAILLVAAASPALAQDQGGGEPSDKRLDRLEKQLREVRDIVLQARATGQPVEIKEAGPDPQVVGLTSRLDDMDQTLRTMTGEIETLQHDLAEARHAAADAQAQSAALADRLDKLEKQVAAFTPAPPPPGAGPAAPGADGGLAGQAAAQGAPGPQASPPPEDPKAAYAHARQLLLDGDYPSAAAAFQDYVDHFGDTADALPARYWIGETKYIQEDYAGAAAAYLGAIRGWPQTAWAPDAVVKLSLSLAQLNKPKEACAALAEFDRRYPHAQPAAKARADAARQKVGCLR